MKKLLAASLALIASPALAGNYATCLLEKLPGVQNDSAARAAMQLCYSKHPQRYLPIPQGDGRGFFTYDSGAECTLDKSASTISRLAAQQIHVACNRLYDAPAAGLFDDLEHSGSSLDTK